MKRTVQIILIALICLISQWNYAQYIFVKQWDKRYGGTIGEGEPVFLQTTDGGYIVGGYSYSGISGDKSEGNRNSALTTADYWIVKMDANGNKEWDKRFGTTQEDFFHVVQQTTDGGYILGGHTGSGINGDKTETSRGGTDFWIVKIDSLGNKQWDKRYGGSSDEGLTCLQQTKDGGYIFCGTSASGISGDKTENNWSGGFYFDYWIVKTDSAGIKQWDKRYGGTDDDIPNDIQQTSDGGYIIGGNSYSRAGGDKTQDNWDTLNPLTTDIWIVRTDSIGNKEWDKSFGSIYQDEINSICKKRDDYILAGAGYYQMGIDSTGEKLWDNLFLGGYYFGNMSITKDGGYLVSGYTTASIAGDKTESNLGFQQTWIVKADSLRHKQWDKTMFTNGNDWGGYALETNEGCYAVANISNGGIAGYKTQPTWDTAALNPTHDFFIVKFCMDTVSGIDARQHTTDNTQIQVWPNPFSSDLSIALKGENIHEATFNITNMLGEIIYHREETNLATGYTKVLDLSYLPNGLYFITVEADGERVVRRVVKE